MELLRIRVLNRHSMIEPVQVCIAKIAGQYKLPEKEISRLNLSVEEAMVNVIDFGLTQNGDQYFDVAVQINGMEFTIVICDQGVPGDFISDNYGDKLGVSIMQQVLDALIIKNLGFNGREQHLIKYLSETPVFEKRIQEEPCVLPQDVTFDIHPLRKEEAVEVARCVYDEFGFSYISEAVYFPEQFYENCQNGVTYSLVATAPNGEIAGHLALTRLEDFKGIAEMGIGVVKKKYRKYSIMKQLTDKIVEYAGNAPDIRALMAEPVAYHTITQKMCDRYQLIPCAFNFQYLSSSMQNTFTLSGAARNSVAVALKAFDDSKTHTLCVPDELRQVLADTYSKLGLRVEFADEDYALADTQSWLTSKSNSRLQLGRIFITKTGEDIAQQLKSAVQSLKRERCQTLILYINAFDTGAPFSYQCARENGFFFTGCFPMAENADYISMQLLLDSEMDYASLAVTPSFSALLEGIKQLDAPTQ